MSRARRHRAARFVVLAALASAFALLPARDAAACHTVATFGYAWSRPVNIVELGVEYADFQLGDRRGSYQLVMPNFEWALHPRLSLGVRLPIASIAYSGGSRASGLGDVEASVKVGVWQNDAWTLSVGLAAGLPTGDVASGLGGGHAELAPFAAVGFLATKHLTFSMLVIDRIALADSHAQGAAGEKPRAQAEAASVATANAGSVLMPHSAHELVVRAAAAYSFEHAYVAAGAEQTLLWTMENGGLVARAEAGVRVGHGLAIAVAYEAPVLGLERFRWRGRIGLQWTH